MCLMVVSVAKQEEPQSPNVWQASSKTTQFEPIGHQGRFGELLQGITVETVLKTICFNQQKECVNVIGSNPHCQEMNIESHSTANKATIDQHLQLNARTIPELSENYPTNMSQFVTSPRLPNSQTPAGRECKGGSKSSTSSTSSHRSGSANRQSNSRGSSDRARSGHRGLSSGSSDSSEDDKDDDDKRRRPYRRKNKEPKSKFSDDEDDEATDSADEGRNEGTPNSGTLDYSPGEKSGDSRSSKYRPSNLPNKPPRSSNGSSSSTISVDSVTITKDTPAAHVPQSPVNMTVGYGIPVSTAPLDNVLDTAVNDKSPSESTKDLGTPTVDSPRRLPGKESGSPGTPEVMSPEIPPTFPSEAGSGPKVTAVSLPGGSQAKAPSTLPTGNSFGTLPFETTWGWQPPVYSPFGLPGSSHPGSVATTPAPASDNTGGFLRPGTTALLQATVCQESEGVLIVTVRWRNRNFSGSLIDIGQHDWAPPKLSCPYEEIQIKDLYKHKEAESQSVNVEVLEDSKENGHSKNEPEIVLTDSPKKESKSEGSVPPPIPMETESITVMASSDPSEVGRANLMTMSVNPESGGKSPYSDISDGSDSELLEGKSTVKESKEKAPVAGINGFYPYKMDIKSSGKGKESLSDLSAHLPSFGDVGRSSKKGNKKRPPSDEYIPDSQPNSPQERSSKTNSADEVRAKLLNTNPGSSTAAIPVSMPEQDQRHTRVASASLYGNNNKPPPKSLEGGSHSGLQTLSDVAVSMMPVNSKDKYAKHAKISMLTQEDFKGDSRVRRSVSPRPKSLAPKPTNRRSPSPGRFPKQTLQQQAATLPSFDTPSTQQGPGGESPPRVVKPGAVCKWGAKEDDQNSDSDSSGSGSIPTIPRGNPGKPKKHSKNGGLSELKTDKPGREQENNNTIQPQTPALAPIPSDKFSLKNFQPISPGVDGPHSSQGHPQKKPSEAHKLMDIKKAPPQPQREPLSIPTVGEALKNVSTTQHGGPMVSMSSTHPAIAAREAKEGPHDLDKNHHKTRHVEERKAEQHLQYHRPHPHDMIHVQEERGSPGKEESKPVLDRGRKRTGPDIAYAPSKRQEREEHVKQNLQRQFQESFPREGEEMPSDLPPEFKAIYDPNLPMTYQYQWLAFINQKKMQDEMEGKAKREYHSQQHGHHPRRQRSNDQHPSEPKLPRQTSGDSNHRSSLTSIVSQASKANGPTVIQSIKSEPEDLRYGGKETKVMPVVSGVQQQSSGANRRPAAPPVRRPAPKRGEDSWQGHRPSNTQPQGAHQHGGHAITITNYPQGVPAVHYVMASHPDKIKHEPEQPPRNGDSSKKQSSEWSRPNSSFSPVIHGTRTPTSSPSHPHSHHHPGTSRERDRERDNSKHVRQHGFQPHQEHERRQESEREIHSSQHPRQNSSSSTSSNHSNTHQTASRNPGKEVNQQAALAQAQQQHQILQMQQIAALQHLQQQQQQLSPSTLAALQRGPGMEEYIKQIQSLEMLQKASIQTLNPHDLQLLQMQSLAAAQQQQQMGLTLDPNTVVLMQQAAAQAQAQQQAAVQQQQQAHEAQAAQAAQAMVTQQALIQAAAGQNPVFPLMYPLAASGQMPQLGFYDVNALAAAGMQVPQLAFPTAVPKRD